jgi:molybdenum cofactor biosynthesis enzyme MoaA
MERVSSATAVEVEDAMSTDQSSRSGKKRAKVWAYVDSEIINGIEKAVCKYCKLQLSSVSGKGTTHLNRHIGYYCPHIPQEDRDRFLASLKNTSGRDNSVFDPVVFRGLVAKYFLHGEV